MPHTPTVLEHGSRGLVGGPSFRLQVQSLGCAPSIDEPRHEVCRGTALRQALGTEDLTHTTQRPVVPLNASPQRVAADVERALERGFGNVYTPWFWRWIMLLIRHVPERVFIRTRL